MGICLVGILTNKNKNLTEPTYAQERAIDQIDQAATNMCGAIRQALGGKKDEIKGLIVEITKIRNATVGELMKPPKDKEKTGMKSFAP